MLRQIWPVLGGKRGPAARCAPLGPAGAAGEGHPRVPGGCGPSLGHRGEGSAGADPPMDGPALASLLLPQRRPRARVRTMPVPWAPGPGRQPPRERDPINGSCWGGRAAGTDKFWRFEQVWRAQERDGSGPALSRLLENVSLMALSGNTPGNVGRWGNTRQEYWEKDTGRKPHLGER